MERSQGLDTRLVLTADTMIRLGSKSIGYILAMAYRLSSFLHLLSPGAHQRKPHAPSIIIFLASRHRPCQDDKHLRACSTNDTFLLALSKPRPPSMPKTPPFEAPHLRPYIFSLTAVYNPISLSGQASRHIGFDTRRILVPGE